jgi:hypothetical protein
MGKGRKEKKQSKSKKRSQMRSQILGGSKMTDQEKMEQAAKAELQKVARGFQCRVCDKVYKYENAAVKHMIKEHTGTVEHQMIKTEKEKSDRMKEFAKERMLDWFPKIEKDFLAIKAAFLQKMLEGELTYTISWQTESLIKGEKKMVHARVFGNIVSCFEDDENWTACLEEVVKHRDEMKEDILSRMPRHNSTSLMSNAVDQWEAEAKAELVTGSFGNPVSELVHYLKELVK